MTVPTRVRTLDVIRGLVNHPHAAALDDDGLDELWRPEPAFVGPCEPPMRRWIRMGCPPPAWQLAARARRAGPVGEQMAFDWEGV